MISVRKLRTYAVISFGVGTVTLLLMFTRAFGQQAESTDYARFVVEVGFLATIGGLVLMVCASLKLPVALCAAQTAVTALLTFWADRMRWMYAYCPNCRIPRFARLHLAIVPFRETWSSINAPTFPLNYADGALVGEILYLMAVAVLWYLVGYFHEHRNTRNGRVVSVAIMIWGVVLLCLCIALAVDMVSKASGFDSLGFLRVSPYGVWALVLIRFGVRNLRSFPPMQTVPS
jgi:hypothetical protein